MSEKIDIFNKHRSTNRITGCRSEGGTACMSNVVGGAKDLG